MGRTNDEDELLTEDQELEEGNGQDEDVSDVDGQDADEDVDGGHSDENQSSGNQSRKPFLVVDDRTQYATRSDAVKGFSEAGKRIAALSAWERELKDYGDLTPAEVREYLDELIESRSTAAQLQSELAKLKEEREKVERESRNGNATQVKDEKSLTREERDAVDWLKQQLPSLGYISKEDALKLVNELQAKVGKIDKLEGYMNEQQERYRRTLIDDSRTKLKDWMKTDGFEDDEESSLQLMIENSIRAYVEADQRRVDKFYAGGAVKDALLKEAYDRATRALGKLKSSSASTYVKNKADALRRNGKTKLPTQNTVSGKPLKSGKPQKRFNSSGKRDFIGEKHNEAWEIASKFFSNDNREE